MENLDRILRRQEVLRTCGISRSSLYEMIGEGTFPVPVRIAKRSVGWRESDIREWMESRPLASETDRP